jgi:small subunit ribosomal protein S20
VAAARVRDRRRYRVRRIARPGRSLAEAGARPKDFYELFGVLGDRGYLCRPKIVEFMANHKATKKDVRQANKRRDRNRYYGKTTRNAIRDLRAIKGGKEAGEQLPEVASMIDKLAKKGVIHKNKAANLKSKLARKINTLSAAPAK